MLERSPSKNLTVTMPVSTTGLRMWGFPKLVANYVVARGIALRNATWRYRYWVLGGSAGLVGVATSLVGAYMFVLPQTINVNFAATNHCVFSPALLGSLPQPADAPFRLYRPSKLTLFGKTVVSTSLCAEPQVGLQAQATYANRLQAVLPGATLTKRLAIRTDAYPTLRGAFPTEPVAIAQPQAFVLNSADATFEYVLTANQQTASCSQHDTLLSCPLQPLKLAYSQTYPVSLERRFKGNFTGTVAQGSLTTISATTVTKSSVANGAIIYDKSLTLTLETDKAIARLATLGPRMR